MRGLSNKYNPTSTNIRKAIERNQLLATDDSNVSPISTVRNKQLQGFGGSQGSQENIGKNPTQSMNLKIMMTPAHAMLAQKKNSGVNVNVFDQNSKNRDIQDLLKKQTPSGISSKVSRRAPALVAGKHNEQTRTLERIVKGT